jgi:hypothetical protein
MAFCSRWPEGGGTEEGWGREKKGDLDAWVLHELHVRHDMARQSPLVAVIRPSYPVLACPPAGGSTASASEGPRVQARIDA